ncbi:copper resistance protein CopC [Amycolatopsis sp. NPDC057786]|uniref:copper resistance CopC family protein n=1 Tax=Amycolatopsis sp. NPDC057786 TaxID=3346250 RepID=UPI0036732F5D
MRKAIVALAITGVAWLATATPALAHNVLISSDPAKGASIAAGPAKITLTFDQYVQNANVNQIAVIGPGGGQWAEGQVEVRDSVVTVPLRPLGPAGEYKIGYRILSADGHAVTGEVPFTLTAAGTGTPASADAARSNAGQAETTPATGGEGTSGVPIWVWIAGAVVLLAVGLTVALRTGAGDKEKSGS